jgi:hypothetical protein
VRGNPLPVALSFGALILSLELLGASIASAAMPANGNAIEKANASVATV